MYHRTGFYVTWPNWLGNFFHHCHRIKQYGLRRGLQSPWKNQAKTPFDGKQWTEQELRTMEKHNAILMLEINRIREK
jgi:hypothetical protein